MTALGAESWSVLKIKGLESFACSLATVRMSWELKTAPLE